MTTKRIILMPAELCFCVTLASQRIATKPEQDRFLAKGLSPFGSHLAGVITEFAAAKVYGSKIDQRVLRNGDQHSADIVTRNGEHLEIKCITFNGADPMLKLTNDEIERDVFFVLAQLSWPDTVTLYPPIGAGVVRLFGQRCDFGYGNRTVLTAEKILELAD